VVVLRDPVTRAFSHYLHLMRYGFIKSDLRQAVISYPEILSASAYATCLKRWFDVFDAESILILYQYDLVERPNVFVNTLCSYLELDYVSYDSVSGKRVNEAALPSNRILAAAGQKVADTLRSVGLYSIVNLAKSLGLKNVFFGRPGERMLPVISEEDRAWLSMMLAQEISDLEVMLGIDLTRWKGV